MSVVIPEREVTECSRAPYLCSALDWYGFAFLAVDVEASEMEQAIACGLLPLAVAKRAPTRIPLMRPAWSAGSNLLVLLGAILTKRLR